MGWGLQPAPGLENPFLQKGLWFSKQGQNALCESHQVTGAVYRMKDDCSRLSPRATGHPPAARVLCHPGWRCQSRGQAGRQAQLTWRSASVSFGKMSHTPWGRWLWETQDSDRCWIWYKEKERKEGKRGESGRREIGMWVQGNEVTLEHAVFKNEAHFHSSPLCPWDQGRTALTGRFLQMCL